MSALADADVERIRRDGYVVLPGQLPPEELEKIRGELSPWLQGRLIGRNDFEGFKTERVYAVLAKAPSLAPLIEHPRVLAIVDRLLVPHYLLSAALVVHMHPGETRQSFHCDDAFSHQPRPRPMLGVSTIWALEDFTQTNGATEIVPGSHLWDHDDPPKPDDSRAVKVTMPAGSVMVFAGSLYHRGGANQSASTRLGFTPQYCQPWLRQIENMVLAVPPQVAAQYSVRVQELLGYSVVEPGFMGYVDGVHPRRLVDPNFVPRSRSV